MPINVASGAASLEFDDISIPGRVALVWNARYSTAIVDQPSSPIGRGWFGLAFCALRCVPGGFEYTTLRGTTERFADPENRIDGGAVLRKPGAFLELFQQGHRKIVRSWSVNGGAIANLCFETVAGGRFVLAAIEDACGDGIDLVWQHDADRSTLLALRQRLEGREMRIGYDRSGWIARIDLHTPIGPPRCLVTYEHDERGLLIRIGDAADFGDRFEYDLEGRVTREVIKDGGVFHYRYDDRGRCVLHGGLGHYNERRLRYLASLAMTEVTDSYGHTTTHAFRSDGQVVLEIDPLGARRTTEYDEYGRIIARGNANGSAERYHYDSNGNLDEIVDPLGGSTKFRFNDRHQPTEMLDAGGQHWSRSYDEKGRLVRVHEPLGGIWEYRHDNFGNTVQVRNPLGAIRQLSYERGVLGTLTDWIGNTTWFQFDDCGRVTARRGPLGETTMVRYDPLGNPIEIRLPDGSSSRATYDHAGNLTSFVDSGGKMTRYRYGPCGRLLARTDANGHTLRYVWGTERNRLEEVINEVGETHAFEHDAAGRVIAEISFDGARRSYQLDASGQIIAYVNANGESVEIARDLLGRIVHQRLPDGEELRFRYDPMGALVQAVNGEMAVAYERDPAGRVLKETQGSRWVLSEYDAVGGRRRLQTSEGHAVAFDLNPNSRFVACRTAGRELSLVRDAHGQEVTRTLPGDARISQRYDVMGRLTEQVLTRSPSAELEAARGDHRREFAYDRSGCLAWQLDTSWGRSEFTYDPVDRLLTAFRSRGPCEQFDYGPTGNITRLRAEGENRREESFFYGKGDRLLQRAGRRYEYDAEGRCIRRLDDEDGQPTRVWEFEWNALDRLKRVTCPNGDVWDYSYDALARRVRRSCNGKTAHQYLWDGQVIAQEFEDDGSTRSWLWDDGSWVAPIATVQGGQLYSVLNDHMGTPRELVDSHGHVVWTTLLDSWGVKAASVPLGPNLVCDIRFQGQWADPESGLHYNFFRYYDPSSGRYISSDPIGLNGGTNAYAYAPNPLAWIDPLGLCHGNSASSQNSQHGYEIIDTHNGNVVVKTGVSGQPLNQNGTSPRANNQMNRWNNEPGNAGRYQVNPITQIEPAGPNARQNILSWEQSNANANRATLDPARHKRP